MATVHNRGFRWGGALALFATLGVALLPAGALPKVAGPCGQPLCYCPPETTAPQHEAACRCSTGDIKPPAARLTLGESVISRAEAPSLAFQIVFPGLLAPQNVLLLVADAQDDSESPQTRFAAITAAPIEVPCPPPRARA
jgi:hypothetical protein